MEVHHAASVGLHASPHASHGPESHFPCVGPWWLHWKFLKIAFIACARGLHPEVRGGEVVAWTGSSLVISDGASGADFQNASHCAATCADVSSGLTWTIGLLMSLGRGSSMYSLEKPERTRQILNGLTAVTQRDAMPLEQPTFCFGWCV